jgi:hypothetical protein
MEQKITSTTPQHNLVNNRAPCLTATSAATTRGMGGLGPRWQTLCSIQRCARTCGGSCYSGARTWWDRRTRGIVSGLGCELWRWKLGGTCEVRQILFLPLGIFDSYVSLIQNKIFFGTLRRISDLTDLAVTSWAFSCLLNPGLYGSKLLATH